MQPRYLVPALSVVCIAAVALCWQRKIHTARAAQVAPYTAHLTRTENRVMPDGSSWNDVSTEVHARDRQGRTYAKSGNGPAFVQDEARLQTLTWDSHNKVATLGHWPYWSGRKGCWADEHGQNQHSFPSEEDWHKIPASPGDAKVETIGTIGCSRKADQDALCVGESRSEGNSRTDRIRHAMDHDATRKD